MDGIFGLPRKGVGVTDVFNANSATVGANFHIWEKKKGATLVLMFALGGGGGGGAGSVGASNAASGGGGGGSAGQTSIMYPALLLPDVLFVSVGYGGAAATAGITSQVNSVAENAPSSLCYIMSGSSGGGPAGGNAAGASAGSAGGSGSSAAATNMRLGWQFGGFSITGQAGAAGGAGGNNDGGSVTQANTGIFTTGGAGGGALGTGGRIGGSISGFTTSIQMPPSAAAGSSTTIPGQNGSNGYRIASAFSFIGGFGGGSSNVLATGAGLFGGAGGAGGLGCGGGGGGACLTGGVAGPGGRGGDGVVIIVQI